MCFAWKNLRCALPNGSSWHLLVSQLASWPIRDRGKKNFISENNSAQFLAMYCNKRPLRWSVTHQTKVNGWTCTSEKIHFQLVNTVPDEFQPVENCAFRRFLHTLPVQTFQCLAVKSVSRAKILNGPAWTKCPVKMISPVGRKFVQCFVNVWT